jgi:acetyl esterase/lipase
MNRHILALAAALSLALPLAAQMPPATAPPTPAAPAGPVVATKTAPPVGFKDTIVLWPNGAPGALGTTEGDIPKLFTYPVTNSTGGAGPHPSVIVMPGGGYTHLVMEQEGAYEARWLAAHGVQAFVLEYRLAPAYLYPTQSGDVSRAIRYVRSHAAELGVDPARLGIWGFSAGGSLAGYAATIHSAGDAAAADPIDRVSDRPDFEIVSYGRMDMSVPLANGTLPMESILGPHPSQAATDAIDPVKHVTADTSPSFLYSTTGDKTVDSRNAAAFYIALKKAGVPAELHVFELGQHGTHMGEGLAPALKELTVTPTLIANWMQLHGWMPADAQ